MRPLGWALTPNDKKGKCGQRQTCTEGRPYDDAQGEDGRVKTGD